MRTAFGVIIAMLLFTGYQASAQRITGCGYKIPPRSLKSSFTSVYEASGIVRNMLDSIKWKENFTLQERNGIQNAYATIIGNRRWIVYDNTFLEDIDEYAQTKWASISVLAHEVGHHYYNHVVSGKGSTIPTEIEADAFSGFIMATLGASLEQSIAAMQAIATEKASATHPAKKDRITAITRGWNQARQTNSGTGNGNTNPNPTPTPTPTPTPVPKPNNPGTQTSPDTDPSWIALSIQSTKDETVMLSDDGKSYQPAVIKAGQAFVFKFEVYTYGWLRLKYYNGYRTFKLLHGKDYNILWNRRTKNWTVVEVPE